VAGEAEGVNEKRTSKRLSLDYDVSLHVESEATFYTGLLKDISTGGVFIVTDKHHAVGDRLRLRLEFPGLAKPFEVSGVVCWVRSTFSSRDMPEGIGVKFDSISPEVQKAINKYLAQVEPLYFETDDEYAEW